MAKSTISGKNPHIGASTEGGYRYPFTRDGLVPVPNKGVPVPELPVTQFCILCTVKSRNRTPIV